MFNDDWHDSDDLEDDEGDEVAMDTTAKKEKKYRPGRYYRNQVSHSVIFGWYNVLLKAGIRAIKTYPHI